MADMIPIIRPMLVLLLFLGVGMAASSTDPQVLTTGNGTPLTIDLPENGTVSSLMMWADFDNTTVSLDVLSTYPYLTNITLPETRLWYFIYFYQPVSEQERPASLHVHLTNTFTNLDFSPVKKVVIRSDLPTQWIFCPYAHACAVLPPPSTSGKDSRSELLCEQGDGRLGGVNLLTPLIVLSILLAASLVALTTVTCYRRNDIFHVYEKPFWPPSPPPLPHPILQIPASGNPQTKPSSTTNTATQPLTNQPNNDVTTREPIDVDLSTNQPNTSRFSGDVMAQEPFSLRISDHKPISFSSRERLVSDSPTDRHVRTIFPNRESINSLYGCI